MKPRKYERVAEISTTNRAFLSLAVGQVGREGWKRDVPVGYCSITAPIILGTILKGRGWWI